MTKFTKEQAVKIVVSCAIKYKEYLMDKSLLFITMDKHRRISALEVFFVKHNFLHLTGLKVDKTIFSANRFFDLCINKKLSTKDFEFSYDGTSDLKLSVLPLLKKKKI